MRITEVRIHFPKNCRGRLLAFASITLDHCFVVRDMKIIDGNDGLFVAMPTYKVTYPCHECQAKVPLWHAYCGMCGVEQLEVDNVPKLANGDIKYYADIVHPLTAEFRRYMDEEILWAYNEKIQGMKRNDTEGTTCAEGRGSVSQQRGEF